MGGRWRTVLQRPVCGAAGLTDTLRRAHCLWISKRTGTVIGRKRMTAILLRASWCSRRWRSGCPADARYQPEVVVSDPYIDLHTGPGRGYPIFYVAAQGDRITILKEQTEWYKIRTPRGKEGWVNVSQMSSTLDLDGAAHRFPTVRSERIRQATLGLRLRRRRLRRRAHSERVPAAFAAHAEHQRRARGLAGPRRLLRRLHGHGEHRHVAVPRVARVTVFRDRQRHAST